MFKIIALLIVAVCAQTQNIFEFLETSADTKEFFAALTAVNVTQVLKKGGPFTVFAPTSTGFDLLGAEIVKYLLNPHNKQTLLTILEYHFHAGKVLSTQLKDGEMLTTLNGFETLTVTVLGASVFLNFGYAVESADNIASNGVVHVISGVLVPPNANLPTLRAFDLAKTVPELSTLVTAIKTGVVIASYLDAAGPLTVLAPTNAAFNALPAGELDYLLSHPSDLDAVLLYHVYNVGRLYSENIKNGEKIQMVDSNDITATVKSDGSISFNKNATVITANVDATNAVVHIISNVLIPPAVRAKIDAWTTRR
jgi:transforming growth factor-beta-induced protein